MCEWCEEAEDKLVRYAISRQGPVKLLLRGAIDLNKPVDNIILSFTQEGCLNVCSVERAIWGQWEYTGGINADTHNSEISRTSNKGLAQGVDSRWQQAHETFNVWKMRYFYWDVKLRRPALGEAAKLHLEHRPNKTWSQNFVLILLNLFLLFSD
jgi:hypothetical protein